MSGRKESLKKSLGLSEYPWSSDDEENTSTHVDNLLRVPSESRLSHADNPGTSGHQASSSLPSSSSRRNQASRLTTEQFWAIKINSLKNSPDNLPRSPTLGDVPLSYVSPLTMPKALKTSRGTGEGERRVLHSRHYQDLIHYLTGKKLSRDVNNLGPWRPVANRHLVPSRSPAGTSRNTILTSSLSRRDILNMPRTRSDNAVYARCLSSRCENPSRRPESSRNCLNFSAESVIASSERPAGTEPSTSGVSRLGLPRSLTASDIQSIPIPTAASALNVNNFSDNSDDDIQMSTEIINTQAGQRDDENRETSLEQDSEAMENEPLTGRVALEEEIVEIDPPDEADANTSAMNASQGSIDVPANNDTSEETNNRDEANETPNAVKKKKRDGNETHTIKEFNMSLLRLLECPVCLEWMDPPMFQCRRGHLVCRTCRARLAACPVCRTAFSTVRNRAMEGVAEMLRYPCRHGCGREVRLRRRAPHEASCAARRYRCPAPPCAAAPPLPHDQLAHHFQIKHESMLKVGRKHKFTMKVNSELHDNWVIVALNEYFHLRADVDIRTWGAIVYVAYIGPKCNAKNFMYQVTIGVQHNARKLVYKRVTHSDLESSSLNVSRQDCFHLTLDQALNFIRFKNRHNETDKFLDVVVEISKREPAETPKDDSDS